MNQFIYTSTVGTEYYSVLKDGKISPVFDTEEWREGLRFIKSLVDEDLLSTLSFTQDSTQYNSLVAAETQVVGIGVSGSIGAFADNTQDYIPLGAIKGENGAKWTTYSPQMPEVAVAITKDCDSPDLAFRLLDSVYLEEVSMMLRFGEKDVDWEYADSGELLYASLGYKPFFKEINNIWGKEQQKNWGGNPLGYMLTPSLLQGQVWDGNKNNNEYKNSLAVVKLIDSVPEKDDLIFKIIYSDEELEEYNEHRANLVGYVDESMVRFVMGDLDLDRDWDSYLNELKKLSYEDLIEMDQKALERTVG